MTKDKLMPIWSEAIISELLVFRILNILPKKLFGEDLISKLDKKRKVLLQINIDKDPNKSGIDPDLIYEYFEYSKNSIDLPIGLMCIPNIQSDPKVVFSRMQSINAELKKIYSEYTGELSMGMSDDYEIALDYGATIIRVGSKIFI